MVGGPRDGRKHNGRRTHTGRRNKHKRTRSTKTKQTKQRKEVSTKARKREVDSRRAPWWAVHTLDAKAEQTRAAKQPSNKTEQGQSKRNHPEKTTKRQTKANATNRRTNKHDKETEETTIQDKETQTQQREGEKETKPATHDKETRNSANNKPINRQRQKRHRDIDGQRQRHTSHAPQYFHQKTNPARCARAQPGTAAERKRRPQRRCTTTRMVASGASAT